MNDPSPLRHVDVAIVGAGPIGIETAVALQAAGVSFQVIEAGPIGHTIAWWAPQTRWFSSNDRISIAGVPLTTIDQSKATREEYLNYLRSVVLQFDLPIQSFTSVTSIDRACDSDPWTVRLSSNAGGTEHVAARCVVLATGGTDAPNRLNVPGEHLPHVDGYLRETHRYHGRRVLIVGGRNSSVEAAIRLHKVGAKVTLSYRGNSLPSDNIKYWLRPEIEGLIRSGAIEVIFDSSIAKIEARQATLRKTIEDGSTSTFVIAADDVLTLIGYRQDKTLFKQLNIPLQGDAERPVFDADTMQTPIAGIYVAGTAIGGTQSSKYQTFLENCHDHPTKIAGHICREYRTGRGVDDATLRIAPPTAKAHPDALAKQIDLSPES